MRRGGHESREYFARPATREREKRRGEQDGAGCRIAIVTRHNAVLERRSIKTREG